MEPEPEYLRRQSLAVPQPIECPPAPNFETRIERSGSSDVEVEHFLIPRSTYHNVVTCTGYTMSRIDRNKMVPVPNMPFRYSLQEFYGTFLEELISQSDLAAFLSEVSRETTTAVKEESNDSVTTGQKACYCLLLVFLLVSLIAFLSKIYFFFLLLLTVIPIWCCIYSRAQTNARINFVTKTESKLTRVIQGNQHQLLRKGILARPGNYGAFIQFLQGYRN